MVDEQTVLQHLLSIEANAAALIDDAQAEADRRTAEAERQNRTRFDEEYAREAALLNENYEKETAVLKEDYRFQLEAYRQSLDSMPVDSEKFFRLVESCLMKA
jgi:regulator of protease activity HflC (stomatin/prohibitin superfamily)